MKLDTLNHGVDITAMPADSLADYWKPDVTEALTRWPVSLAALVSQPADPFVPVPNDDGDGAGE